MGKLEPQLPINNHHHHPQNNHHQPSLFVQFSTRLFTFKCVVVLLLTVAVSLSAVFSVFRFHHRHSGFDAPDSIKHAATVQAYFQLEKPLSFLIPQIARLEYVINDEIGVPATQVAILSMHESGLSNSTDVVFGVLSKPMHSPIYSVSLSILRFSLVDLFTQSSNLRLTESIFGAPSSFQILKFPGGITIIPKLSSWMPPQVLFNFTLHNSLYEIEGNYLQLEKQLKSGLRLMSYESVYLQLTNKDGSTNHPPVTVQASIASTLGSLEPERLNELAREITGSSPAMNLGLDHTLFGKVKEISLSSYLYHTLDAPAPTPTPSPAPSPDQMGPAISPSPDGRHYRSLSPSSSPLPAMEPSCGGSPRPGYHALPSHGPPSISPLPDVSYGSSPHQENGRRNGLAPSPHSVLPSSSSGSGDLWRILCPVLFILITLHII
ncbi:uncharacterized protein LOC143580186 isoform X2 [Bidens hawaiensis]|uniref:uncharacterized protein LOC143580186 isoform X2 n=1 Tax=Bidens hawaiensis TaxID=980011 RepID=UPI004049B360